MAPKVICSLFSRLLSVKERVSGVLSISDKTITRLSEVLYEITIFSLKLFALSMFVLLFYLIFFPI